MGGRFGYVDDGQTPNSQLMFFDYEPAPIIFEVRGLPKDKSFLNTAWDKAQNNSMDTYCGLRQGTVIHCEGGYVAQNKAFDKDGKLIRQFQPTTPNLNVNFIEAVLLLPTHHVNGDRAGRHGLDARLHVGRVRLHSRGVRSALAKCDRYFASKPSSRYVVRYLLRARR